MIALTEFWPLVQTQMAFPDTPIRMFIQEWFDDHFYTGYIGREAYKISELTESGPLGQGLVICTLTGFLVESSVTGVL